MRNHARVLCHLLSSENLNFFRSCFLMVFFYIKTGMELAGVVGLVHRVWTIRNLHKKGGSVRGVSAASPMPKSVSFLRK